MSGSVPQGLSLSALKAEYEELRKDYVAFSQAYDLVRHRILESSELQPPRVPILHEWSGSRAICGSFELSIHSLERTITEYGELIEMVESGEIANIDTRPVLSVIDGGIR